MLGGLQVTDTQAWFESKGVGPSAGRDWLRKTVFRLNFGCFTRLLVEAIKKTAGLRPVNFWLKQWFLGK